MAPALTTEHLQRLIAKNEAKMLEQATLYQKESERADEMVRRNRERVGGILEAMTRIRADIETRDELLAEGLIAKEGRDAAVKPLEEELGRLSEEGLAGDESYQRQAKRQDDRMTALQSEIRRLERKIENYVEMMKELQVPALTLPVEGQ